MIIDDENVIEVPNPFNNGTIHIVKDMFNEPMLIAKEILITLGYKDHKDAVKKHLSELAIYHFYMGEGVEDNSMLLVIFVLAVVSYAIPLLSIFI